MSDEHITKLTFDRTLFTGILSAMITLAIASVGGGFALYQGTQTRIDAQKDATTEMNHKIEMLSVDLKVVKENINDMKASQKEQDNGMRKSLESISDDLLKLRLNRAGRNGRSGLLFSVPDDSFWPDTGTSTSGAEAPN